MMYSAAIATNETTRKNIIEMLHTFASSNRSSFCVEYEVQTGVCFAGSNSPAQAGLFALLGMR